MSTCLGLSNSKVNRLGNYLIIITFLVYKYNAFQNNFIVLLELKLGNTSVQNHLLNEVSGFLKVLIIENGTLESNTSLGKYALPKLNSLTDLILVHCSLGGKQFILIVQWPLDIATFEIAAQPP